MIDQRRIVVPGAMLRYAIARLGGREYYNKYRECSEDAIRAAIQWLADNPIAPSEEQERELYADDCGNRRSASSIVTMWQRRMFLAPEEIPGGFIECDTCRAKPGSPTLCAGCRHNRNLINKLQAASRPAPQPDVSRVEGCIPRAITFTPAEADYMFECIRTAAHGWSPNTATCAVPDRRSREEEVAR